MLDGGFRVTFRHFWTLFFLAAAVTVPLHLIYVFMWHGVIGLRELAPQIADLPAHREVHFVSASDVRHAGIALWGLDVIELCLLPFAIRAARAVIVADQRDEVPTVRKAWRGVAGKQETQSAGPMVWLVAALVALAVGGLLDGIGRILAEPWGPNWSFVILGLTQGSARAAGAAFFLGPIAFVTQMRSSTEVARGSFP